MLLYPLADPLSALPAQLQRPLLVRASNGDVVLAGQPVRLAAAITLNVALCDREGEARLYFLVDRDHAGPPSTAMASPYFCISRMRVAGSSCSIRSGLVLSKRSAHLIMRARGCCFTR